MAIEAVVFDMDGVLVDSEALWSAAREQLVRDRGGRWRPEATTAMQGMSSVEWSAYMQEELGVPMAPAEISAAVVARMRGLYRERLPLIPGAVAAVEALADRYRLAVASSANREIIDLVLALAGLSERFADSVSSEEVAQGKPAPDVYLEAARRLSVAPERCAAVEDSSNGLRSAAAAGMAVIALPNREFAPAPDALAHAAVVLGSLDELRPGLVEGLPTS